jgi:chemotaxis signal transduction protein
VTAAVRVVVWFRSGGRDWAVAIDRVQQVLGAKGLLPLPDPKPGVAGLLYRDGQTVTVVSPLDAAHGQVLVLGGDGTTIGLLVDEVVGIERVQEEQGAAPAGQRWPLVAGVLAGPKPLLLLDVGALTGWLAP